MATKLLFLTNHAASRQIIKFRHEIMKLRASRQIIKFRHEIDEITHQIMKLRHRLATKTSFLTNHAAFSVSQQRFLKGILWHHKIFYFKK
jgi:hypothetical protein